MCGFLFHHSFDDSFFTYDDLDHALDSLRARGPDELRAYAIDNSGCLHHCRNKSEIKSLFSTTNIVTIAAHARLAITGEFSPHSSQPYYDRLLNQLILFNGEVYNFKELASKYFPSDHHAFKSDTYLLSLLIRNFGIKAFDLIEGIFSVLVYKLDTSELSAFRDPVGVKPLYYSFSGHRIALASTLKACISSSVLGLHVNKKVASRYLKSGRLTSNFSTIVDGYYKLPPGFTLSCDFGSANPIPSLRPWFSYDTIFQSVDKVIDVEDDLLVSRSISTQIPCRPFALLLSAGIDSSVVALECSKHRSQDIHSYTGKSSNMADDESVVAAHTSSVLGLHHQTISPSADDFESLIDEYMSSTLTPLSSFSHLLELFIYQSIKSSGLKVVLAGHGADELFSGYTLTDPILCFISSLFSLRLRVCFRFLRNYRSIILSPYSIAVCAKVVLTSYSSVIVQLLRYPSIRLALLNRLRLLLNPLLCVRFNYLFLDSQLQSQVEPTDLASMFSSLECRIPLISLSLIKEYFSSTSALSVSGTLKSPLRSILKKDYRTALLAKPLIKRGFQYAYSPASSGPFRVAMNESALRLICLNKLKSLLKNNAIPSRTENLSSSDMQST